MSKVCLKYFLLLTILLVFKGTFAVNFDSLENIKRVKTRQIDSFITSLHHRGLFNGTLLVADNGNILYHQSMGLANLYKPDSIKNDYLYQMASVSKPITAAAVMLLVQRGEIGIDDKIVKYFPELMSFNKVTVRHLLNHTSGIPDYIYRAGTYWTAKKYMGNDDLLVFLSKRKYKTSFVPGSSFNYSNTNYALLASLIERVTEERFDDYVRKHIFDPLEMCNTVIFNPEKDTAKTRQMRGYSWNGRKYIEYDFDYRNGIMGDKGVFSTADDMMRFAMAFSHEGVWCLETCSDIFTKTRLRTGVESEYGAGWRMREWDGYNVTLHYGFWNAFRTGLIHFPESDITFVILNNLTGAHKSKINNRELIIRELMKIMFTDPATAPVLVKEQVPPEIEPENPELPETGTGEGNDK